MIKQFKKWEAHSNEYGPLFSSLIQFNNMKSIVEIGVARGTTTAWLCKAAADTGGYVYGFDIWEKHGKNKQFEQIGAKKIAEDYLYENNYNNFTLTKIDSRKKQK